MLYYKAIINLGIFFETQGVTSYEMKKFPLSSGICRKFDFRRSQGNEKKKHGYYGLISTGRFSPITECLPFSDPGTNANAHPNSNANPNPNARA
jgi:hypothetical protein